MLLGRRPLDLRRIRDHACDGALRSRRALTCLSHPLPASHASAGLPPHPRSSLLATA
jgi:hypothetical protein